MTNKLASITRRWGRSIAVLLAAIAVACPALAQDYFHVRPLRYGNTSTGNFDMRDDNRDFPNNGFFPGNFAINPPFASVGAAGFLESNPQRSPLPYPSQVYFGQVSVAPVDLRTICARRYRSYDPASGTFVGRDGLRHPC